MAKRMATAQEAFDQVVDFLEHFDDLEDPRQHAKVLYPLDEVLLLALLGVLAGCESWVEIARYGEKKLDLLRRFRPFCEGTPSHDQLGDIFAVLDARQFQHCFIAWVSSLTGLDAEIVAVDGKTLRRSYQEAGAKAPIHMISAWSARQNLVLGQAKVADKSNEIVAIPELLALLSIEGATVTIDAMGCQREIARKIIDQKADYVLGLKSLPPRRRGATRAACATTSNCSLPSKRHGISPIPASPDIRRWRRAMAASRPAASPPPMTSTG